MSAFVDFHDPPPLSQIPYGQTFTCLSPYPFTFIFANNNDKAHRLALISQPNNIHNINSRYVSSADTALLEHRISELFFRHFEPSESQNPLHRLARRAGKKHSVGMHSCSLP